MPIRRRRQAGGGDRVPAGARAGRLPADPRADRRGASPIGSPCAWRARVSVEASRRADEAVGARVAARVARARAERRARRADRLPPRRRPVGVVARSARRRRRRWRRPDTTVLLLGESGTGKEVVARFLHRASPRRRRTVHRAELRGAARAAARGRAVRLRARRASPARTQSKPGQLEQAGGGVLFLDEVGEMSPPAQAKFLRVLQEREFQRLGGTRVLRTDARVVAATNRDLAGRRCSQRPVSRGSLLSPERVCDPAAAAARSARRRAAVERSVSRRIRPQPRDVRRPGISRDARKRC